MGVQGRGAAGALPSPIPEGSASLSSQTDRSESSREALPAAEAIQHLARPSSQAHLQANPIHLNIGAQTLILATQASRAELADKFVSYNWA